MLKVKLEPNEVELALNIASKRYIGNLRMGKTFSYGYTKGIKSQLTDGILGALGEVAYAKATNSFYNGSYSDDKTEPYDKYMLIIRTFWVILHIVTCCMIITGNAKVLGWI